MWLSENSWTHKFFCLSRRDDTTIPTTDSEKNALLEAGLGERKIVFPDVDASAEEFRNILFEAFPKLQDGGGFTFCKGGINSRRLEPLSTLCLTSPAVLRDRAGNARTYIIPLQKDLDVSSVENHSCGVC